jgi:hypothetical protein
VILVCPICISSDAEKDGGLIAFVPRGGVGFDLGTDLGPPLSLFPDV